jgi:hypothetical protein
MKFYSLHWCLVRWDDIIGQRARGAARGKAANREHQGGQSVPGSSSPHWGLGLVFLDTQVRLYLFTTACCLLPVRAGAVRAGAGAGPARHYLETCVCVCVITSLCKVIVPFRGGGSAAAWQRAPLHSPARITGGREKKKK